MTDAGLGPNRHPRNSAETRPLRFELAGVPQQAIPRGNNLQATFCADADDRALLGWLGEVAARHGCSIHAYVQMTNPVHLLLPATGGWCHQQGDAVTGAALRAVRQ